MSMQSGQREKSMIILSYIKLQCSIIRAANWKIWNYHGSNAWFLPTVTQCLHMWACLISDYGVHLSNHKMKYELLIVGIRLMHNFVVSCAKQRIWLDACSIAIYGKVSFPFWEHVLMIFSFFFICYLLRLVMFLKMILIYHSVPNWYVVSSN